MTTKTNTIKKIDKETFYCLDPEFSEVLSEHSDRIEVSSQVDIRQQSFNFSGTPWGTLGFEIFLSDGADPSYVWYDEDNRTFCIAGNDFVQILVNSLSAEKGEWIMAATGGYQDGTGNPAKVDSSYSSENIPLPLYNDAIELDNVPATVSQVVEYLAGELNELVEDYIIEAPSALNIYGVDLLDKD